jgi:hypothetical protein
VSTLVEDLGESSEALEGLKELAADLSRQQHQWCARVTSVAGQ